MRVPDEIRKCVGFVGCDSGEGRKLVGTCFFLGVDIGYQGRYFTYAVTAAHVIEGCQRTSIDGRVWFRMNRRSGGIQWVYSELADWRFHPEDRRVDVAVLTITLSDQIEYLYYPLASSATEEVIKKEGIGVGEELFLAGLFISHYGTKRNIPIVRVGNIAAMPSEPIQTKRGATDAYLVEARSIGGLSGSPVFVHLGLVRHLEGKPRFAVGETGVFYLLGLMMGHYDVRPLADALEEDGLREETVNMGIATVAPVSKIQEVINHPELIQERLRAVEELRAANLPVEDQSTNLSEPDPSPTDG